MHEILEIFKEITTIEHCSFHTQKLKKYLINKANEYGYKVQEDKAGNILASSSYPKIALQAHYDMVCVGKAPKIETYQEEGWLKAKDSSLGADNGIALAMILYLMSKNAPIEALFTNDEEVGLIGANNLELNIQSPYLLNLDSEDEGEVFIGCAGGVDLELTKEFKKISKESNLYELQSKGFSGGHSGVDIDKNIANAIIQAAYYLKEHNALVSSLKGGEKINSIPVSFKALVAANSLEEQKHFKVKKTTKEAIVYDSSFLDDIINFPNGVLEYNKEFDVVESSSNLALIDFSDGVLKIEISMRSLDNQKLQTLAKEALKYWESRGYSTKLHGKYPAWKPEYNNFAKLVEKNLAKVFKTPKVKVIHAGLECGILKEKMPHVEFASIGPTIKYPHSVNEKLKIDSVFKTYEVLESIINEL
jgi:dipeptidase D